MRALASVLAVAVLTGCAAHSYTHISAGARAVTAVPPPGTSSYSGYVNISAASSSAAAALAGIALLGFVFHGYEQGYWDDRRGFVARDYVPELAADRVVHEQDCSKPIENPTANLRCR
jgi:hypothetical protein